MVVALAGTLDARQPHRPHKPRPPRAPHGPDDRGPDGPGPSPGNVHLAPVTTIALPGRGHALAWSPDGRRLAAGGHFAEKTTGLRYDTRVYDAATGAADRSFACHYYWVGAVAWSQNPFVGEVIADGAADHAVKVWDARGGGSTRCQPGQLRPEDGGIVHLPNINGWITGLAFSPDGRWLAGVSRDRAVRIWQVAGGARQWRVVRAWRDGAAGNFLSVAWAPDGHALATGDRRGRVVVWPFDPLTDLWDDDTVDDFRRVSWQGQLPWFSANAAVATHVPLWSEGGHGAVWTVRWSPDGDRLAAASADGLVSVFDTAGAVVHRLAAPRSTSFQGLDWSPDGRFLAAGAGDHAVYVFDAATGEPFDRLDGHADDVAAVAWSPDGRKLASTAGGPRISMALHGAVSGPDQTIRVWAWRSGT